jgi:hypothetical protein
MGYRSWAEQKCELAKALDKGALGGSYAEAAIILCATISAMSSLLWLPSRRTDRHRFLEIVTRFGSNNPDPTRVSAPLLADEFPQLKPGLQISGKSYYLTGEADKSEAEAVVICTAANLSDCKRNIRRYSYVSLLYEQVRCGFVHEYRPGSKATEGDAMREIFGVDSNCISYVNQIPDPGALATRLVIHFPLEWIGAVARSVASGMDRQCAMHSTPIFENLGLAIPHRWWSMGS